MTAKQRKSRYWFFKILSILVACGMPISAVVEHFPLWTAKHGSVKSISAGGILCLVIVAIVFRTTVFNYLKEKLKLHNAPPLAVWLVLIIIAYVLIFISQFVRDLVTVLWMGFFGCVIGSGLTYVAENYYGNKEEGDGRT